MPAPEGRNGAKNKEMFLRFLNGFSTYVKLGRLKFHDTEKKLTMEEAREKFRDFWSPPLDELIQSWLRMETLQTLHRTRSTHGLMRIFEDKYSALIRNKGRFLFHDVTRMLGNGAVTPELKRDLQYRMYCPLRPLDAGRIPGHLPVPVARDQAVPGRPDRHPGGAGRQHLRGGGPQAKRLPMARGRSGAFPLRRRTAPSGGARHGHLLPLRAARAGHGQRHLRLRPDGSGLRTGGAGTMGRLPSPRLRSLPGLPHGMRRIWQTPRAEETSANDLVCQAMADILEQSNALRRDMASPFWSARETKP